MKQLIVDLREPDILILILIVIFSRSQHRTITEFSCCVDRDLLGCDAV
jgi:hypothetical protein